MTPAFVAAMLGREEHEFRSEREYWRWRSVLVTGAGGYIGTELCRRLQLAGAQRVVAVEVNELALVNLMRKVPVCGELADVRNSRRMSEILGGAKPQMLIHAAAYKHVPLLEQFPFEAIENNAMAAARLADLAESFGVERFVLVSTDKAVEPAGVLGLSKRLAEMTVVHRRAKTTRFAALRCGNVLGSPGSVVPLWMEEREAGLPLTVTDPDAERFFVSRGEAAGALLRVAEMKDGAGLFSYALQGAIQIRELAQRLRRECGNDVGGPAMRVIGLSAGERQKEPLHGPYERLRVTSCPHILRVEGPQFESDEMASVMCELEAACGRRDREALLHVAWNAVRS